jgi:hypothetical protein
MFSAAGTSGSFFFLGVFRLVYVRADISIPADPLSRTYLLLFRSLFFDEPHDSSSFFLNRTAGNPTASTHLLELLLLMHPVMYSACTHLFISPNRSARRVGVGLD